VLQFLAGFIVALVVVVPALMLLLRKKVSGSSAGETGSVKQLEEVSKLAGELAHEIKNPLSTMKINLKLVVEDLKEAGCDGGGKVGADKKVYKFKRALRKIGIIEKEADRLEQILEDFMRYVDRSELQLGSIDINSLISDMVDFYSPQAYSHSVTLRAALYGKPLVCRVDGDMLKQAVLNLFINARQAMKDGGELMVRTSRREGEAVIQISDTGTGIAPEKLANIFNPYYSCRSNGTGLGLPTTKRIIESHGGTIGVESEPGKGTSFTIKLPLQER